MPGLRRYLTAAPLAALMLVGMGTPAQADTLLGDVLSAPFNLVTNVLKNHVTPATENIHHGGFIEGLAMTFPHEAEPQAAQAVGPQAVTAAVVGEVDPVLAKELAVTVSMQQMLNETASAAPRLGTPRMISTVHHVVRQAAQQARIAKTGPTTAADVLANPAGPRPTAQAAPTTVDRPAAKVSAQADAPIASGQQAAGMSTADIVTSALAIGLMGGMVQGALLSTIAGLSRMRRAFYTPPYQPSGTLDRKAPSFGPQAPVQASSAPKPTPLPLADWERQSIDQVVKQSDKIVAERKTVPIQSGGRDFEIEEIALKTRMQREAEVFVRNDRLQIAAGAGSASIKLAAAYLSAARDGFNREPKNDIICTPKQYVAIMKARHDLRLEREQSLAREQSFAAFQQMIGAAVSPEALQKAEAARNPHARYVNSAQPRPYGAMKAAAAKTAPIQPAAQDLASASNDASESTGQKRFLALPYNNIKQFAAKNNYHHIVVPADATSGRLETHEIYGKHPTTGARAEKVMSLTPKLAVLHNLDNVDNVKNFILLTAANFNGTFNLTQGTPEVRQKIAEVARQMEKNGEFAGLKNLHTGEVLKSVVIDKVSYAMTPAPVAAPVIQATASAQPVSIAGAPRGRLSGFKPV